MKRRDKLIEYEYSGVLKDVCHDFVRMKRAVGYKYNSEALILRQFSRFTQQYDFSDKTLPKEVALAWNEKRPHESAKTHMSRVNVIKLLAEFMVSNGMTAHICECLPSKGLGNFKFKPYIFTDSEISDFFKATDDMKPGRGSKRHIIMPLIFRILLCCGMRVSEVLKLKNGDIDFENGILTVRQTKFAKDRYVPMSEELTAMCKDYYENNHNESTQNSYFFPTPKKDRYDVTTIGYIFMDLLHSAGISHGGRGVGPRIHDFRHTFAVRCLRQWVISGEDITAALPALSTYLGHADLRGSEFYLRLTSDLFPNITAQCEEKYGDIIPQIGGHEFEN